MSRYTLHRGDNLPILQTLADHSIDAIVTDPPYGISFMGNRWDYDVPPTAVWAECLRILKPGGHLLAFAGTRTQHRMAVRIEDAGFEIRDMLAWVYGSGFPKSHNLDGDWDGWGTALKPALEPITMARKPFTATVAANVQQHGTGALNVDGCRVGMREERPLNRSESIGFGGSSPQGLVSDGGQGRWPANLLHDGSDEVLQHFPEDAGGCAPASGPTLRDGNTSVAGGKFNGLAPEASPAFHADTGSAARFYYCAKASNEDREDGIRLAVLRPQDPTREADAPSADNPRNRGTRLRRNQHPTVKPTDLMRWLVRLVTPPGGLVLDPYMGSGSTGKAAMLEGFRFLGIDRDADQHGNPLGYMAIAEQRIAHAAARPRHMELALKFPPFSPLDIVTPQR